MESAKYGLIVVGGGFAGVMAACAAARDGVKTLLLEKSGMLGGAASVNYVLPFMGYKYTPKNSYVPVPLCRGLLAEFLDRLRAYAAEDENPSVLLADSRTYSEEFLKIVMDDMTTDYGVDVLFHSTLVSVCRDGRKILSVTVANVGGPMTFSADCFIDATGDALLAFLAGVSTHVGREADNKCQPMTLCFRIGNIDFKTYSLEHKHLNELWAEKQRTGELLNPREDILSFHTVTKDILHLNTTRVLLSPVDPYERSDAEKIARRQMLEVYRFLRRYSEGCKNATLLSSSSEIGVRESRMIDGIYTLTGDDIVACRKFDDAVAAGNYEIDIHSPDGSGTHHVRIPAGEFYHIPYRALVPKDVDNLLAAGRCISSTHEAQAAYRIMPIVACIGEGAGIAAALALNAKCTFPELTSADIRKATDARNLIER